MLFLGRIQAFDLSDGRKRISGACLSRRRPKVLNRGTAAGATYLGGIILLASFASGAATVLLRVSFAANGAMWRGSEAVVAAE